MDAKHLPKQLGLGRTGEKMKIKSNKKEKFFLWLGIVSTLAWTGSALGQGANQTLWANKVENGQITQSWGTRAIASGIEAYDAKKHKSVMVIVLDTGVGRHESLKASMPTQEHWVNVSVKDNPNISAANKQEYAIGCNPHATHVAGIIGGKGNAFRGVFPGVPITSVNAGTELLSGKNCSNSTEKETIAETFPKVLAFIYNFIADKYKGHKKVPVVINISAASENRKKWEAEVYNFFAKTTDEKQVGYWLKKIATPVGNYPGAVIVLSAGNFSINACYETYYANGGSPGMGIAHPSDGILVVGALDRNGQPAMKHSFWAKDSHTSENSPSHISDLGSNYGKCVDIWAPGHEIYSAWGDQQEFQQLSNGNTVSNIHRMLSGTSMSAPHITGLAAYLIATSTKETLTPADVEQMLRARSVDLGSKANGEAGDVDSKCSGGPCKVWMPTYQFPPPNIKAKPSVLFKLYSATLSHADWFGAEIHLKKRLDSHDSHNVAQLEYESSGATQGCKVTASKKGDPTWKDSGGPGTDSKLNHKHTWDSSFLYLLKPGVYTWTVTCTGDGGAQASATAEIEITTASRVGCTISPRDVIVANTGGPYAVQAVCEGQTPANLRWSVQNLPDNFFESFDGQNLIWYNFPPNDSAADPSFVLRLGVRDGSLDLDTINIRQEACSTQCSLKPSHIEIPKEGGQLNLEARCSMGTNSSRWTVTEVLPSPGQPIPFPQYDGHTTVSGVKLPPNDTGKKYVWRLGFKPSPAANEFTATITQDSMPAQQPGQPQNKLPVCKIIPEVSTIPYQGGYYTVSADCTNEPTSYTWTVNKELQPGKTQSIGHHFPTNPLPTPFPLVIVLTATNKAGTSTPVQVTVYQAAPPLKPVCTLTPQVYVIPYTGGIYSAGANCTNSPTSYTWTVNGEVQPSKINVVSYNFPANTLQAPLVLNIVVTATNSGGTSTPVQVTIQQAGAPPPKPVCTLIPQVSTIPYTGGYYSVSANCSGNPTSYTWTVNGELQPGKTNTIGTSFPANTSNVAKPFTIVVTATNSGGTSVPVQVKVNQAAVPVVTATNSGGMSVPVQAKPVCSVTPQVSTIPHTGGYYTVSANCSGNPMSYTWTVNGMVQPGKGSSIGNNFPPNTSTAVLPITIVVTATNSMGTSAPVQVTVNQARKP